VTDLVSQTRQFIHKAGLQHATIMTWYQKSTVVNVSLAGSVLSNQDDSCSHQVSQVSPLVWLWYSMAKSNILHTLSLP